MKTTRILILSTLFIFILGGMSLHASAQKGQTKEIKIKTEFRCNSGKTAIEKELMNLDGVKKAEANLENKVVTVTYDPSKLNKDKLVAAIEKTGYRTEYTPKDKQIKESCGHQSKAPQREGGCEHEKK